MPAKSIAENAIGDSITKLSKQAASHERRITQYEAAAERERAAALKARQAVQQLTDALPAPAGNGRGK